MRRADRSGFTLIELLVAFAIMALIMTALLGTVHGTLVARDEAEIEVASVRDGPRILDMIERDLRALHVYNLKDGQVLRGERRTPGGLRGDRIDFVCSNDAARRLGDGADEVDEAGEVASDLNEVGYRLRAGALSDDFMELWRREDLYVDEEPFDGGSYEKIHDRVTRFEITYLDHLGDKADEESDWDMAEKKRLPGAVRIDLELQASPELVGGFQELEAEEQKLYRYTRIVAFPDEQNLALSVRPYLPVTITGRNDNAGLRGGKGGGTSALGGAGTGGDTTELGKPSGGGQSLAEMFENGGIPGGDHNTNFHIDFNDRSGLEFNVGAGGELSPQDEARLEEYLSDYQNRFRGGRSGTPPPAGG